MSLNLEPGHGYDCKGVDKKFTLKVNKTDGYVVYLGESRPRFTYMGR